MNSNPQNAEFYDCIKKILGGLPADKLKEIDRLSRDAVTSKWLPYPGPQTAAYISRADVLLYGGEPGGGKSQLILGLAFNDHKRSLIMRRRYVDLDRLVEDAIKIHGSREGFNGSPPPRLRISDDQVIQFRAAQNLGDEQGTMGQGRDFLGIDEATHFAESQVRFLMGWVRSEDPNQRCRTVLATNPPLQAEGLWVVKMFAPWLDDGYRNKAQPGELRWVVSDADGNDEWVDGPDDVREFKGRVVRPQSRTYIPASVRDNPAYRDSDYERQLLNTPEPLRSLLLGGFRSQFKDAEFQVIPTAWVDAAQRRWTKDGYQAYAMTAMAFDPAGGGDDAAELCWRHGPWYAPLVSAKGDITADGSSAAATIVKYRRDAAPVIVDMGGGYGGSVSMRLGDNSINCIGFDGAAVAMGRAKGSNLRFSNKRAEAWWRFREALDPDQEGGSPICLPPDNELKADLSAPTFEVGARGLLIESKDSLRKRLGRSPGKGDAVVMCLSEGNTAIRRSLQAARALPTRANVGYSQYKRL